VASEILVGPDDWNEPLGETDGPQLVVGGPGSGKTEFLVRRARLLIDESNPLPCGHGR